MAAEQTYLRPVLLLMSALEATMFSLGSLLWYQTKNVLHGVYDDVQSRAAGAYQGVRRRASDVYDDLQVKAGDTYQVMQSRTAEAYQQWLNRVNLVYIQCQLRVSLILHRCQFQLSLLYKDVKLHVAHTFHSYLKEAQKKTALMHRQTKIKVTKWKKAAAETAKVSLERMSRKAREYEDVLDQKLHNLSRSPSAQRLKPIAGPQVTLSTAHLWLSGNTQH